MMLSLPPTVKIYCCRQPADLRRGYDGLAALAQEVFQQDPLSGHLFLFRNRRADRVKILYWDRDGYAVWMKRLERGRFRFPEAAGTGALVLSATELAMILGGVELAQARRQRRYQAPSLSSP
jgi:transposase